MPLASAPHARALLLLAGLAVVAGLVRVGSRLVARTPDPPWTAAAGVPVELAGDGVYFLPPPATVASLLARAGHDCAGRGRGDVPLAAGARVTLGARCVPRVGRMVGAARLTLGLPLDPNRDSAADLAALPGVGPHLAARIVRDRERHGPFASPEALLRVPGVGPATLRALRTLVRQRDRQPQGAHDLQRDLIEPGQDHPRAAHEPQG